MYKSGQKVYVSNVSTPPSYVLIMWEYHLMKKWEEEKTELTIIGPVNNSFLVTDGEKEICIPSKWLSLTNSDETNVTKELKPCPFCGGEITLAVSDDEGNPRPASYELDPWSGLSFKIMHHYEDNKDCPIANYKEDQSGQGVHLYDSREEAINHWNTRKG